MDDKLFKALGTTPGPWDSFITGRFLKWISVGKKGTECPSTGLIIAKCGKLGDKYEKQSISDCRLIAAAPEMLEALINIGAYGALRNKEDWNKIQPVIEKATGKSWDEIKAMLND